MLPSDASDHRLLDALLDSWDPNNTTLVNLLRAVPEGGLAARALEAAQPSVSCSPTSTIPSLTVPPAG